MDQPYEAQPSCVCSRQSLLWEDGVRRSSCRCIALEPGSHVSCGSWDCGPAPLGIGGDRGAGEGTNGLSRKPVRFRLLSSSGLPHLTQENGRKSLKGRIKQGNLGEIWVRFVAVVVALLFFRLCCQAATERDQKWNSKRRKSDYEKRSQISRGRCAGLDGENRS